VGEGGCLGGDFAIGGEILWVKSRGCVRHGGGEVFAGVWGSMRVRVGGAYRIRCQVTYSAVSSLFG